MTILLRGHSRALALPFVALATFKAGHRIRLIVSSSNHPKYAVNWNDGLVPYTDGPGRVAENRVYSGGEFASQLVLPVVAE